METDQSKSFRDQYSIRQGRISLYRRTAQGTRYQSDNWYAAFKITGQRLIRRSLKTSDQMEAEILAENQYYDLLEKSKRGLSLTSKKFRQVANAYLNDFAEKVNREQNLAWNQQQYKPDRLKAKSLIIQKYLIPYFKDKTLQDITDFDIDTFKEWRKTYWISGIGANQDKITYLRGGRKITRPKRKSEMSEPNYSTVNKELTVLRQTFEYARLNRLIQGREIPVIKNLRKPKDLNVRKSGLTEQEIKRLLTHTVERYRGEKNPKHKRHLKLLLHYMAWMCLTGCRVAEAKNLHFPDCEPMNKDGKEYLKIFVHGKGKSREMIGLEESKSVLDRLRVLHQQNAEIHGWHFQEDMPLFLNQYGKQVKCFAKGLDRAFNDAGLLYDKNKVKRSAGAFRKYYITQALLVGRVNYFELAKQCGTSVSIIEKYYAEIEAPHIPEQFIFINALSGVYDD